MKYSGYLLLLLFSVLFNSCVSAPAKNKYQFSQKHYTYTILSNPREPKENPQMEIAMSLLQMNYPEDKVYFINTLLYPAKSQNENDYSDYTPEAYKNRIIREKRDEFRSSPLLNDWRYAETINIISRFDKGIILERKYETFTGGAHGILLKNFYVIDMENNYLVNMDDLFENFQREEIRAVVYRTLRANFNLRRNQPLSEGLFFSDEPELSFKFYVKQEGLVIYWDPYEIAPYSSGPIEVLLYWRDIRPFMLTSGMELLTKFNIYLFVE